MNTRYSECNDNVILATDSQKVTHHLQYPSGTKVVHSYFECSGGIYPDTVFFGLQYILKKWLVGTVITKEKVEEAGGVIDDHYGSKVFNYDGWMYILNKHGGKLPLLIKAVPEGIVVPCKNVLFTVENTDPECFWLTNYIEALLVQIWYPMTVCTHSRAQKQLLASYLHETADTLDGLLFKLNDFGFRASTSVESASIGACAHLVNFRGSSTLPCLAMARKYYGCSSAGFSIPSAEHSTITTWTKSGEAKAFTNILNKFPNGSTSVVSDSYNIWNACEKIWGDELKELVIDRGKRGSGPLVVRPDSGDPATVVTRVLEILGSKFGTTVNSKGYKLLPPYIRVIQGDGISYETLGDILEHLKLKKWSADNIAFGSGGGLLQKVNRDTQKCAYKCSYAVIDGKGVDVYKEPITDPGKKSKRGILTLERNEEGQFITKTEGTGNLEENLLVPVFENGVLLKDYTLDEVRDRAELPLLAGLQV